LKRIWETEKIADCRLPIAKFEIRQVINNQQLAIGNRQSAIEK